MCCIVSLKLAFFFSLNCLCLDLAVNPFSDFFFFSRMDFLVYTLELLIVRELISSWILTMWSSERVVLRQEFHLYLEGYRCWQLCQCVADVVGHKIDSLSDRVISPPFPIIYGVLCHRLIVEGIFGLASAPAYFFSTSFWNSLWTHTPSLDNTINRSPMRIHVAENHTQSFSPCQNSADYRNTDNCKIIQRALKEQMNVCGLD